MMQKLQAGPAHYPLFLDLAGRRVLVVGGDETAARKTHRLLAAGARVAVSAEVLDRTMTRLRVEGRIDWIGQQPPEDLAEYWLVVVADADAFTHARLKRQAERARVWINAVDDPENCTALVPAVVDRSPIQIAIGTGGLAPELARQIRSRIEAVLPASLGPLAALAGRFQRAIRARFPLAPHRRQFLDWIFNGEPAAEIAAGRDHSARSRVHAALAAGQFRARGQVALVGAGPGEPGLLTIAALHHIQSADTIIHDGLVDRRILTYARRDATLIDGGKRKGSCREGQDRINHLLAEHAANGERVVRLKGGDPMVFGRGGEELEYLRKRGIDYQVVPGITAAVACGAYAGIPLTHRDHAHSVRLVTAHCQDSIDALDWPALAADDQTLAFYMAVGRLEEIESKLLAHGRSPATPITLVENGTRPDQRVITGCLESLAASARSHGVQSPAMLYVGEVAALAAALGWYGAPAITDKAATACA